MLKSRAIEYYGTARALAEALGITEQAVSQWDGCVPRGRAWCGGWVCCGLPAAYFDFLLLRL